MRLVCEWIEVEPPRVGLGLSSKFDLRIALVSLAKAELVEAAFMNSVWDLLIVDAVLIAGTIMLPLGFEQ